MKNTIKEPNRHVSADELVKSIITQFNLLTARPDQVKKDCDKLRLLFKKTLPGLVHINLEPLFPLLQKRSGPIAEHLFSLLEGAAEASPDTFPFIKAMLSARDKNLALRALKQTTRLSEEGRLQVNHSLIHFLAERLHMENTPFTDPDLLLEMLLLIKHYEPGDGYRHADPFLALYLEEDNMDMRRLAARLLDSSGKAVSPDVAETVLGKKYYKFFTSYLSYTRAMHTDLLCLQPLPGILSSLLNDFIHAEKIIGKKLLYEVIAKLGWSRLNLGLEVDSLTGVAIDGSPPFMVSEAEASLLGKCTGASWSSEKYLIVACGGQVSEEHGREDENDPIARFRSFNLNHAALLSDFLDIGPLSVKKVRDMIGRMDQIVEDYVALFKPFSDECAVLPGLYREMRNKIFAELDEDTDQPQLSADLTRLVQSFEDPRSLGEVRTLHGLKRYLHQQGLSLGFRLVEGGRSPNRNVDILIATKEGIQFLLNKIRYADFEPAPQDRSSASQIPFSVKLLIDGFARQMLHGQDQFPHVDIFCYGNEVHYYFGFRNHPAFLRIDFAPPLRGGMIDLEYFGVSNYELDQHPNISLDAIRIFFERMEFDILIEGTRIHARYDKERALNLGDLCRKARHVFRMAPYFMDLDWTVGSLALESEARRKVAEAWTDFFLSWGFLPLKIILTKNRSGILTGFVNEPTGRRETVWSGKGNYEDIYTGLPPAEFYEDLMKIIRKLGLEIALPIDKEGDKHPGQLELEERALNPLRKSVARGELIQTTEGLQPQTPDLFVRVHEAELFAELLAAGSDKIAIGTARLVRPLERSITFNTTGSVNGYLVQKAVLALRGEEICFYVLRGADGMIRLAFFIREQVLYKKRKNKSKPWISNACYEASELAALLRANDFVDTLLELIGAYDEAEAAQFIEEIKQSFLPLEKAPLRGERIVTGLKASPGRSVGKALFGTEGRNPQDFTGSILVAASIKPEDTTCLYYADGIISTGGGILSHAGLIAMQFRKPALIISGKWRTDSGGQSVLFFNSLEYQIKQKKISGFNVCIRSDIHEKEYALREGDLLILDALAGNVRVLGQERDVLALYEGFRMYNSSNETLAAIKKEREILNLRGKRLRARHQLENVLRRCSDPVTARYAIFEILLNEPAAGTGMIHMDKGILLKVLLNNPLLAADARDYLMLIKAELKSSFMETVHKAESDIPSSDCAYEVLSLRLDIIHHKRAVESAAAALVACDIKMPADEDSGKGNIESLAAGRLSVLREKLVRKIKRLSDKRDDDSHVRHLLRQLERIDTIRSIDRKSSSAINKLQKKLAERDNQIKKNLADRYVIGHSDGGFELFNFIGWKAANLAEIERLAGGAFVPPWFVVTDKAFREALDTPVTETVAGAGRRAAQGPLLQEAINTILDRDDLNNHQKSLQIRGLWERIRLPDALSQPVIKAYRKIIGEAASKEKSDSEAGLVYVAVRSSSQEEDTEAAARAGEFETYLYIHGEDQLLYYLKRTWSGLWTERAIHNQFVWGGNAGHTGGGVIMQRMVNSRVSGVLQTVNIPRGNLREMVINAGLGLGEGVVSGTVAADQVTVSKGTDPEIGHLRFSYITSDKTEQIVFNRRAGFGTVRLQTLYHQRLRPALEYVELCQLVRIAASLEKAYGYPLDIEFGIEGSGLWLLQARPVASFLSVLNETLERFPLKDHARVAQVNLNKMRG
jgi:pyruvate,water dikinase